MKIDVPVISPATPKKRLYRQLVVLSLFLVGGFIFYRIFDQISDLITTVVISFILAYVLRPIVGYTERLGVSRIWSILGLFVVTGALLALSLMFLIPVLADQVQGLNKDIQALAAPEKQAEVLRWVEDKSPIPLSTFGVPDSETLVDSSGTYQINIMSKAAEFFTGFLGQSQGMLSKATNILAGAANIVSLMSIVPIIIFFILKDGDKLTRKLISRVPNRFFEMTLSLVQRLDQQLSAYIISVLISSLFVGVATWVCFSSVGIQFALVLGILGGLLNVIPFFGPFITIIPTAIVVMLTYTPMGLGLLWMLIILIAVQQIESIFVKPMIMSKSLSIHAVTVIIVVLIGGRLAGALGMFIAVPVYSIIQLIVIDLYGHLKQYRII